VQSFGCFEVGVAFSGFRDCRVCNSGVEETEEGSERVRSLRAALAGGLAGEDAVFTAASDYSEWREAGGCICHRRGEFVSEAGP